MLSVRWQVGHHQGVGPAPIPTSGVRSQEHEGPGVVGGRTGARARRGHRKGLSVDLVQTIGEVLEEITQDADDKQNDGQHSTQEDHGGTTTMPRGGNPSATILGARSAVRFLCIHPVSRGSILVRNAIFVAKEVKTIIVTHAGSPCLVSTFRTPSGLIQEIPSQAHRVGILILDGVLSRVPGQMLA